MLSCYFYKIKWTNCRMTAFTFWYSDIAGSRYDSLAEGHTLVGRRNGGWADGVASQNPGFGKAALG